MTVLSGGSEPRNELNPVAVMAMSELGIDISTFSPTLFTIEMIEEVDVVVTMGCGDACPIISGKKYVDWPLDDPAGKGIGEVRQIRDEIRRLVSELIEGLANDEE